MNDTAPEPALSPLNPAFDGHAEGVSVRDVDLESEGSPEPESQPSRSGDHEMPRQQPSQASWSDHRNTSSMESMEQSASPHGRVAPQPDPSAHLSPLAAHQHNPEHSSPTHMPLYVGSPTVYYQSAPAIPDPAPPTLEDAEEAINTLITFLDSSGQGIIQDGERLVLNTIKCALFQAGSGIPFDRSRH
jgi:hypothetical protein